MADRKTVEGHGPLPSRKPFLIWRGKYHTTQVVVDVLKAAARAEREARRRAEYPGYSKPEKDDDEETRAGTDTEKVRATAAQPIFQGKWIRPAGINVPIRETARAIVYPFGVTKLKKPVEVLSRGRVTF